MTARTRTAVRLLTILRPARGGGASAVLEAPSRAPVFITPVHGRILTDATPDITWVSAWGADAHDIEVATDSAFTSIVDSDTDIAAAPLNTWTSASLSAGKHYVRVRGTNDAGTGDWSNTLVVIVPTVAENFTYADATDMDGKTPVPIGAVGNAWDHVGITAASAAGATTVSGNAAIMSGDNSGIVSDAGDEDMVIEAEWIPAAPTTTANQGYLVGWYNAARQCYVLFIRQASAKKDISIQSVNTTASGLAQRYISLSWAANHHIKMVRSGTALAIYVDDIHLGRTNNATLWTTATKFGVGRGTGSSLTKWENVFVYPRTTESAAVAYAPLNGTAELRVLWTGSAPSSVWESVSATATVTPPAGSGGSAFSWKGFFYSNENSAYIYMFRPPFQQYEGDWTVEYALTDGVTNITGSVTVTVADEGRLKGFVRSVSGDAAMLEYGNGDPAWMVGLNTAMHDDTDASGSPFDYIGADGGVGTNTRVALDYYLRTFAAAGFNLYRITPNNVMFPAFTTISTSGNTYEDGNGKHMDVLVRQLRYHGFAIMWGHFHFSGLTYPDGDDANENNAIKRYYDYVMARWGWAIDIWDQNELQGAGAPTDLFYEVMIPYLKSIDPFNRIIAGNDEAYDEYFARPDLDDVTAVTPHWYETESELESDERTTEMIALYSGTGLPIIFG